MTPAFQRLTKRYVNVLGVLVGIAVASSILLYSACGTGRPNIPTNPTPTPIPTPTPDTTAPTVTSRTPAAGAVNVRVDANVTVTFSEAMDPNTVNVSTIELRDPASVIVPATVSYDAASGAATLDPIEFLSAETTYTARVKGGATDPRVKDVAGNALAADVTWTFKTAPPPQVLSVTPTDGAPDVLTGVAPRATFSKPLDPMSLSVSTVLLQDAAGKQVPINGFYTIGTVTVAIVPQTPLQPLQTYRVILRGGADDPHITDSTGAPLPSDYTWSFTTTTAPPPPITTYSIFAPTATPAHPISDDSQAAEVGMKFRSDSDGFITGVRFYKGGPQNGGFHEGHLWASDGTMLSHANFRDTESGWQQALFGAPFPITANTTYVVSYDARQGHYAADPGYFASTGVDNPPLHALRDGDDGGNGVILHNPFGGFPTETIMSTNYYVDVVFSPRQSPPQVTLTSPRPGAVFSLPGDPPAEVPDRVAFSEPIDPTTVNASTVLVTDTANKPVPFTIFISSLYGNTLVDINVQKSCSSMYTVTLKGGVDAPHITSATGTPLPADYTFSYIEFREFFPDSPQKCPLPRSFPSFAAEVFRKAVTPP